MALRVYRFTALAALAIQYGPRLPLKFSLQYIHTFRSNGLLKTGLGSTGKHVWVRYSAVIGAYLNYPTLGMLKVMACYRKDAKLSG